MRDDANMHSRWIKATVTQQLFHNMFAGIEHRSQALKDTHTYQTDREKREQRVNSILYIAHGSLNHLHAIFAHLVIVLKARPATVLRPPED